MNTMNTTNTTNTTNPANPTDSAEPMNSGRRADTAADCGPFPSLGEIGLLIVATAAQNLALTGRRTAERRGPYAAVATAPGSH